MKSKAAIQLEYRSVCAQASKLEASADELAQIRNQLDILVDNLRDGWAGESANLYFQKCEALSRKISTSQKDLDKIASVIRRTAKIYRDTEMAAIAAVQD